MGSIENRVVKPVHLLRLGGLLLGVVDNELWSAGEASAIAEVALPKIACKGSQRKQYHNISSDRKKASWDTVCFCLAYSFRKGLCFLCHEHIASQHVSKPK